MDSPADRTRRRIAQGLLAGALWPLAPGPGRADGGERTSPRRAFSSSFAAVPTHLRTDDVRVTGKVPRGLAGRLYRNGPALMRRGDTRYRHWFDGDGMVQRFDISAQGISHTARMVETTRHVREREAGRFLHDGFGTHFAHALRASSPDAMNVANISIIPDPGTREMLALWEAGSAWRIDPDSLETLGPRVWSAGTEGAPFSAHPKRDPDGRLWSFGYLPGSGKLLIYDIAPDGRLGRTAVLDMPNADMVHDFAVTPTHLVFVLFPLRFSDGDGSFLDGLAWHAGEPSLLVLIDKESLQESARHELDPFFFFHLGHAWNEGDDVHVQVMRSPGFDSLMHDIEAATAGRAVGPASSPPALEIVASQSNGGLERTELPLAGADFPSMTAPVAGPRDRRLVALVRDGALHDDAFGFDAVALYDPGTDDVRRFSCGSDYLAEEHLLVAPSNARDGAGWIVGTAYDWRREITVLNVFDAGHLDDGPVATAELDYGLPMGLHGTFIARG